MEKAKYQEGFIAPDGYVWTRRENGTFGWRKPKKDRKQTELNFDSLRLTLKHIKDELSAQSIFSGISNDEELNDINRVLTLTKGNKIKINGRFKINSKTSGIRSKISGSRKAIHWESGLDLGREIENFGGKQESKNWATALLQEAIFKQIAEEQGVLISAEEQKRWGKPFDEGSEAQVYYDPDDATKVFKTVNAITGQSQTITSFIERSIGFNKLFPETSYDLIGFVEDVEISGGIEYPILKPVVKQKFVKGKIIADLENPDKEFELFLKYYKTLGFNP